MTKLKPPEQQNLEEFLRLVGISLQNERLIQKDNQELLLAAHFLLSAVAGKESWEELAAFLQSMQCCFGLTAMKD